MLFNLAWKNIWRNKKRSLIIIAAIAVGLWSGLFATAVMVGMWESTVNSAIDRNLSHIQIHTKEFMNDKLLNNYIPDSEQVIEKIKHIKEIKAYSGRVIIEGMASSPTTSYGVTITGINPSKEKRVTTIANYVTQGKYFEGIRRNPILIGEKLADKLGLKLHSKIVLSFQGLDSTLTYAAFRIVGIFKTESSVFDESNLFVRNTDIYKTLNCKPFLSEIAIRLNSAKNLETVNASLQKEFPDLFVESWKKLAPELQLSYEMMYVEMYIFLGVILFALLFGITNTMLMSVMDRIREFGVLIAVGMKRMRLFILIILETIFLSLFGGIVGMIFGALSITYFSGKGIDLSLFTEGLSSWGISSHLYPNLPLYFYFVLTVMIIFTAIFAAIYPAVKTVRLQPAKAIRTF